MRHRAVGGSGLKLSEVACGTWIGRTEDSAAAVAREALRLGITTFDTADVYGATRAEVVLGKVLAGLRRESLEICTKVYAPTGPGPNDRGLSRKHIMEAAHASLRRLRTDYIDLYLAHRYDHDTPVEETLQAFDDLVRQGKVLYVGVSEWTARQIGQALRISQELGLTRIIANQPQYNMLWRVIETEVMPLCRQEGIGQLAWSPLAQGLLTGKYRPGVPPPRGSRAVGPAAVKFAKGALDDDVLTRVAQLVPLAGELGCSMAQLAIAWVLRDGLVSSAIVGASTLDQLADSVLAAGMRLDDDVMERVDEILGPIVERDPARTPAQPSDYRDKPSTGSTNTGRPASLAPAITGDQIPDASAPPRPRQTTTARFDDLTRLMTRMTGDEKHAYAATSTLDVLWVLYSRVLRVGPEMADDRDRFYLSKGHGPMAYYAVLSTMGFFDPDELALFGSFQSRLGHHPDRVLVPGVEISSGSLGHGLPIAVGTALGLRARGLSELNIWVLMGDGELDEGSNYEAITYAGRTGLDQLHVVVVDNTSASLGWPGGLETRFAVEGWSTARVNGRDHGALEEACTTPHPGRPRAVVAQVQPADSH